MKIKKGFYAIAMAVLLCVPATQSFAFSWSPVSSRLDLQLIEEKLQTKEQQTQTEKIGSKEKDGTVIGEINNTRTGINDVFRSILMGSVGGALTSSSELANLMKLQIYDKDSGANAILSYVNKLLGTEGMFSMKNGKIDMQLPVSSSDFNKVFEDLTMNNKDVDLSKLHTSYVAAEEKRNDYVMQQMNETQARNKELAELNSKIVARINEYNKWLNDDAKKTKEYQEKLKKMDAEGADEKKRQELINERNQNCLSEADIQRIQTAIASDNALISVNTATMKANNENLKVTQESAKLQSEMDKLKRQEAEAKINEKSSEGFLQASLKTKGYDPSKKYDLFKD